MPLFLRAVCAFLIAAALSSPAAAQDATPPIAEAGLVPFSSEEGLARLARTPAKQDFPALANQFEAQSNIAFCGPATAAIVLNAIYARSPALPRDRSRLHPDDLRYLRSGMDPTVPRYTQENVFDKGGKTRAQVLGEPMTVAGKEVRDGGFQLRQFDELLKANGLATRAVVVDDAMSEQAVRADLMDNLDHPGNYAIVNYKRENVGQRGGGHISPLGAYDAQSDSFLVLDVNPAAAGWVWMPTATLVKGMRSFDMVENRGYILVKPR